MGRGKGEEKRNQRSRGRREERLCRQRKWKNKSLQKQTWLKTESCSSGFCACCSRGAKGESLGEREKKSGNSRNITEIIYSKRAWRGKTQKNVSASVCGVNV